jgi:hypothetical protein
MHLTFAEIIKGTVGFAQLSRGFFRMQGAAAYVQDGTLYTCMQDALVVILHYLTTR